MTTTTKTLIQTDRKKIREFWKKSDSQIEMEIGIIKSWLKTQKHLPEIPSDNVIEFFLTNCKFSVEKTKQTLDMHYTVRHLIPEYYENRHPRLPHMKRVYDSVYLFPLPRLTENLNRILLVKYRESDPDIYDPHAHGGVGVRNIFEIRMREDLTLGEIFVIDFEHVKISQLMKYTPTTVKKQAFIFEYGFLVKFPLKEESGRQRRFPQYDSLFRISKYHDGVGEISSEEVMEFEDHHTKGALAMMSRTFTKNQLGIALIHEPWVYWGQKVWANRVKEMHFINCPSYVESFMHLGRTFLSKKLKERLFVHEKIEDLYKIVPQELLPSDYGGKELSLEELKDLWLQKFEEYNDRFDEMENLKVNEKLRPEQLENSDLLGFHGNFKKIEID